MRALERFSSTNISLRVLGSDFPHLLNSEKPPFLSKRISGSRSRFYELDTMASEPISWRFVSGSAGERLVRNDAGVE